MSRRRGIDPDLYRVVRRLSPALQELARVAQQIELVERGLARQLGQQHTGRPGRLRRQVHQAHASVLCAHLELLELAGYHQPRKVGRGAA